MMRTIVLKFIKLVYNKTMMMKALFLILCLFPFLKVQAQTTVEIYADGRKYDSLSVYKASKHTLNLGDLHPKAKVQGTVPLTQTAPLTLSELTMHELYGLGVEEGVLWAMKDFYQTLNPGRDFPHEHTIVLSTPTSHPISAAQMEGAIKKAVTASGSPKFLISEAGKMRILTMTSRDVGQSQ